MAAHVAEVVDGTILYFPSGDYWFTDTLDLSSVTATNVRLWNPAGTAKLRGGVRLGAASNVTVDELVFSGCAGPAIVATNTAGLTVTDCTFDKVGGLYEDGKKYLFAAVNVTDFNVTAGAYVTDGMQYDGQGFFAGGTQAALSEAYADAVVVALDVVVGDNEPARSRAGRLQRQDLAEDRRGLFRLRQHGHSGCRYCRCRDSGGCVRGAW